MRRSPPHGWAEGALAGEELVEVGPVDEAHGHVELAVGLAGLEDRDHVGMVDRRRQPGLALEALAKALVDRQLGCDELERDRALEGELGGAVDDAHPAAPDQLVDSMPGEDGPRLEVQRHTRRYTVARRSATGGADATVAPFARCATTTFLEVATHMPL